MITKYNIMYTLYYMYQCIKNRTFHPAIINLPLNLYLLEIMENAPDFIFDILLSDYMEMPIFVMLDPTSITNDRYDILIMHHMQLNNIMVHIAKAFRTLDVNIIVALFAEHWEEISCDIDVSYWEFYKNKKIIIDAIQIVESNTILKKAYSNTMHYFLMNHPDIPENINILRRMSLNPFLFKKYLFKSYCEQLHKYFNPECHEKYEHYFIILQYILEYYYIYFYIDRIQELKIIEWFINIDHRPLKMSKTALMALAAHCVKNNITIHLRLLYDLHVSNQLNINMIYQLYPFANIADIMNYCDENNLQINLVKNENMKVIDYIWNDIIQNKTQSPYFDNFWQNMKYDNYISPLMYNMDGELLLELDKRNYLKESFIKKIHVQQAPLCLQYKWLKDHIVTYDMVDLENLTAAYNDIKIICKKFDPSDTCSICYQEIGTEMIGLPCDPRRHYMCNQCFKSYEQNTCHICRKRFQRSNTYKLIKK